MNVSPLCLYLSKDKSYYYLFSIVTQTSFFPASDTLGLIATSVVHLILEFTVDCFGPNTYTSDISSPLTLGLVFLIFGLKNKDFLFFKKYNYNFLNWYFLRNNSNPR